MNSQPHDFVPHWAKGIVWYQIFPERFWNGDPQNDPRLEDQRGAYPHDPTPPWQIHPWTSDWYELQPYEQANGKGFWHNVQRRRYGGDLQGILDRLDYLQSLGVGGLYLNPVFESPSAHKYDGATYHHVDPNFGPDPRGDRQLMAAEPPGPDPARWVWTAADRLLVQLIAEVHRRGMRIILDGVFNHMGLNSWAFRDVQQQRHASPYGDWFTIESWGDPQHPEQFRYRCWENYRELPSFRQDENGIVAGPRDYIFHATRRWMDPDGDGDPRDGIDGWRLDVAFCVKHPFWKAWRKYVKAINPEAYLTGEIFGTQPELARYLQGDEFDAAMNYPFAVTCAEYFVQTQHSIDTGTFDRRLRELREAYPACVTDGMQNLFGSHDTNRLASHLVNRAEANFRQMKHHHRWSTVRHNPDYDSGPPTDEQRRRQQLFVIFQFTYPGAPMIYYGDEMGMWGGNDPCCRKPMFWPELDYAAETHSPDGQRRAAPSSVSYDQRRTLLDHYRRLIQIRRQSAALQRGDFQTLLTDNDRHVFAFQRQSNHQTVIVILNRSLQAQPFRLPTAPDTHWDDLLNGDMLGSDQHGMLGGEVPGQWGRILRNR